jgi:hypothetical protein
MNIAKRICVVALLLLVIANGCVNHDTMPGLSEDYLVFGSYYGMCAGNCSNFFLIDNGSLYKIGKGKYPNQSKFDIQDLTKLNDQKYEQVKDLVQDVPSLLFQETQTVIGCPDCADAGGLYIETKVNGERKYWYIDNVGTLTPEYLHSFVVEVNDKIRLLTQ